MRCPYCHLKAAGRDVRFQGVGVFVECSGCGSLVNALATVVRSGKGGRRGLHPTVTFHPTFPEPILQAV